jgi:hemerythrin-like domain-containing protein
MRQEHDVARSHVREAAECLQKGQFPAAAARLTAYRALLVEHIRKEDEILYPYLDSRLSLSQVGDMFSRFAEVERDFGDAPRLLEEMIVEMEGRRSRAQQPLAALAQNSPK